MLDKILHNDLVKGNKVYGVHMQHESEGYGVYRTVLLSKKKSEIEIEEKELKFDSVEAFSEKCDKSIPVILTFDSKQVLSRKVIIEEEKSAVEYLLPNASENDFYSQEWILNDSEKYISVVRKDLLDPVIRSLHEKGYMVLHIYLGAISVKNILGIADDLKNQFFACDYSINIGNEANEVKKLKEIKSVSYSIGSELITSEYLIALASGIDFFLESDDHANNKLLFDKENFLYKQLFVKASWAILVLIFIVLLVNYMFYMRFDKQRNELNSRYAQNIGLISKMDTLRKEVAFKESFLGDKGFMKKSITSYYSDRIATSVPKDIVLTDLNVYPLLKQIKQNESVNFSIGQILLKGTYLRSTVLNKWIVALESYDWIENVEIEGLLQEKANNPGEFELMLSTK